MKDLFKEFKRDKRLHRYLLKNNEQYRELYFRNNLINDILFHIFVCSLLIGIVVFETILYLNGVFPL